jgi:hypothetical protein
MAKTSKQLKNMFLEGDGYADGRSDRVEDAIVEIMKKLEEIEATLLSPTTAGRKGGKKTR